MAKKNDFIDNFVTHREILNFAILYMADRCEKQIAMCGGDMKMAKEHFGLHFVKLKKLCEAYEIETGNPYELSGVCGLEISDLN